MTIGSTCIVRGVGVPVSDHRQCVCVINASVCVWGGGKQNRKGGSGRMEKVECFGNLLRSELCWVIKDL